jgi:hypothetical protein
MIKKLFFLFLLPSFIFAQNNFSAIDSNVVWQKVFNENVSASNYIAYLNKSISQENPAILLDQYTTGQSTYMDLIEDKKYLSSFFKQPAKFDYQVDFKDDRYRVTVRNIAFKGIAITLYGVTNDADTYLDESLIRNRDGKLRKNNVSQKVQTQLNLVFTKIFTYSAPKDW